MIPPLVLQPLPGELILDMCASPGSKPTQMGAMMENISGVLKEAGSSFDSVFKCVVYLADMSEWGAFNRVYVPYKAGRFPARTAIGAHQLWLALAGIANSAIALYYYMTIVRAMYFLAPVDPQPLDTGLPLRLTAGLCSAATLILGLAPGPLLHLLTAASSINLL